MKYAIIDIGSNTIRLVLYNVDKKGISQLMNKKNVAGLASYKKDNQLTKKGIDKLLKVLDSFLKICKKLSIEKVYTIATASIRNVENSKAVLKEVNEKLNTNIKLASGNEEAYLGYLGAKIEYNFKTGALIDIGGGSTELTLLKDKKVDFSKSFPLGSLSLYSDYSNSIISSKKELLIMKKEIESTISKTLKGFKFKEAYGMGGTIRACGNVLQEYFELENSTIISKDYLDKLYKMLLKENEKLYKIVIQVAPARIHTFAPGIVILKEIFELLQLEKLYVSKYGIREGYLVSEISKEK